MEDIFKPNSLTIQQLFGNADSLYQIPRYQRPYAWGDDQLEKLWDDFLEAKENDPNYFLGSIITAKPEDNSNYLDIVDGQQRLTTLTVLLCIYRNLYPNINEEILKTDPFAIDSKTINSSIKFNDRFERLRLRTHPVHQSDFENIILNSKETIFKKPTNRELNREEPKYKFANTAYFFAEKLNVMGKEEAGLLLNYIYNKVTIIRIDCQSVSFAIKLFQVLNDRGLELSNSDLIKSYLLGKIQKLYENDLTNKKFREDQFMADWKDCESNSNNTEIQLNELFIMYEYYLLGQNPKRSLYDELVIQLKEQDPNSIIKDVKEFIENYKNKIYDNKNKDIYSFFYISWRMYWRAILLTALKEDYEDYDKFLKKFKRYFYLNWIAGFTLTRIKQTSFNIIKWLKEKKDICFINNELETSLRQNDTIKKAIDNLNGEIYYESWCKPLLFMLEYEQTDSSVPVFFEINDRKIQIEHIFPRGYNSSDYWKERFNNNPEMENWINKGGNLTLLSGTKNLQASNYSFGKKMEAYSGCGFYSEDSENRVTSFRITQKIVDDYNLSKFNKEWSILAIKDRWIWFCGEIERILDIDLSTIKKG
jgi:uncharacterized protein with ParB-like and HNH nuclease domain